MESGTDVDTGCDRNEQLCDRIAGADGGQRQLTGFYSFGKTAYDDGVSHLVQLLERNAEQQRNREPEQLLRRFFPTVRSVVKWDTFFRESAYPVLTG